MPVTYLKRATRTPASDTGDTRATVERMLGDIEARGEAAVRDYAASLDGWTGAFVVPSSVLAAAGDAVAPQMRDDIAFAHRQVDAFARHLSEIDAVSCFAPEARSGTARAQDLLDCVEQSIAVLEHDAVELFPLVGIQFAALQRLEIQPNRRHRCFQFVSDGIEK